MSKAIKEVATTFDQIVLDEDRDPGRPVLRIPTESVLKVARFVNEKSGFDHVISVSVIDNLEKNQFVVTYHLSSIGNPNLHGQILSLEIVINRDSPKIPSLTNIWSSAEFHERESWEMFGVEFEGHPKLERLLLPESWEGGYPLRKDYKLKEASK